MNRLVTVAALGAAALVLKKQMSKSTPSDRLSAHRETIEVDVPVSTAYNQWTQFEEFPRFMAGVLEVRQLDDSHLHWRAKIAGKEEEWDAEITEQIPDKLIAWQSTSGAPNEGMVMFKRLGDDRTRIDLQMTYQPRGLVEAVGDAFGAVSMRVSGNLQRFKDFIENRGSETGAWRGSIDQH